VEFAVVIGTIVATIKDPSLIGTLFLVLQPITHLGKIKADPLIAVDTDRNAGYGDIVIFVHSPDASMAFPGDIWGPVDAAVVAIVDHVDIDRQPTLQAGQVWKWDES
jgi:ethanolamine utilization protein EutN